MGPNGRGGLCTMWWKLLIGAIVGLLVGHFVTPGYWLWVIVGLVAGYLAELWAQRGENTGQTTG